ncbi:MAG: ABC transporter transmembrane domain-containing protein [Gemmobacter sp.]
MLDSSLSRYIWRHTKPQQVWILCIVALSMIPYFMSFNLPKMIVNGPIQGTGFESPEATQLFGRIALSLPALGEVVVFPGVQLERLAMLMALSAVFLGLVIINGLFKFYINIYKGRLGERLLRRLRFSLVDRVLRFPPATFKRMKGSEIASMVKDEVEPIGGFTGDAFVSPALLGGQALTALVFIYVQSVPLGLITTALVGVQVFIIPRMRRRLLVLGRERQLTARQLSGRVSEIVDGIHTIHAYDTSNYERADIAHRLGRIFKIRFDIYQWKFLVKFINNFLASVTPFLFYSVGGYLALNGQLDIGQLVAVIGAYKDLPGPLKELIDWDQLRQDVQVKYSEVVNQFAVDGMIDPRVQVVSTEAAQGRLTPPLAAQGLVVTDDSGANLLQRVDFSMRPGESVAIVGNTASGGDVLAEALARIVWPSGGKVVAGGQDLHSLPEAVTGRAISYAGSEAWFFSATVRENLFYGLKHAPLSEGPYDDAPARAARQWALKEAKLADNPDFDVTGEWIDYAALGVDGPAALMARVLAALDAVLMTRDVLDLALRSTMDPALQPDLARGIVAMREALHQELGRRGIAGLIVPFEPGTYNAEATVFENLLFGNPRKPALMPAQIGKNPYFRQVLAAQGLDEALFVMGREIARNTIELFADLPPDHPFFQQLTFMTADEIPAYQALLQKLDSSATAITDDDRNRMIRLSFDYVEPRHRFGLLTPDLMDRMVAFRQAFHAGLPEDLKDAVEQYSPGLYIASAGLLDNMLFGRISHRFRDGADRVSEAVTALLQPLGLYDTVLALGLDYQVGTGGKRLTAAQRQKLNLCRALFRRSDYYLFNRPLSALDRRAQEQIINNVLSFLRQGPDSPGIAWVVSNPAAAALFDRVAVFDRGTLADQGPHDEVKERNGIFREMLTA